MKLPDPTPLDRWQLPRPLWRYAWAFPATAFGLCLSLIAHAGGATGNRVDGVLEVAGGVFGRALARLPAPFGFCAITLGHVVVGVDHRVLAHCRSHEHAHVRQYERWGLLFFLLYAASSLWEAIQGNGLYRDNHFERQARAEAETAAGETTEEAGA